MEREFIYGINPVLEALKSGMRRLEKIYILRGKRDDAVEEIAKLGKDQKVPIYFEPREILDRISATSKHQGVIGYISVKEFSEIEEIIRFSKEKGEEPFVLILDSIEDPRNLGAIIRTADAAGVHGIILPQRHSSPITNVVAKASAGAIEYMKVARVINITKTIENLKELGVWVYGLDVRSKKSYLSVDYKRPLAIVVGNEGRGIRRLILENCDERISLPMKGNVSSLNVSVAMGIISYEVIRQRG